MGPRAPSLSPSCCPAPLRGGVTHGREDRSLSSPRREAWLSPLRVRGKPPAGPQVSGGTGGERPRESPQPPAEAGGSRRSKHRPGTGGPLPGTRSDPFRRRGARLHAACLHPRPGTGAGLVGWEGQHPQTAGILPRLASPVPPSLSQRSATSPVSLCLSQCPQHLQSLSAWSSRSQSILLPPVLVQRVEPGDRMLGCNGVRGGELPCVESRPAVGIREVWGA